MRYHLLSILEALFKYFLFSPFNTLAVSIWILIANSLYKAEFSINFGFK